MKKLALSDLKVMWYLAKLESTRWKRPLRTFWNEAIERYKMLDYTQRTKTKRDLDIKNHLIKVK